MLFKRDFLGLIAQERNDERRITRDGDLELSFAVRECSAEIGPILYGDCGTRNRFSVRTNDTSRNSYFLD